MRKGYAMAGLLAGIAMMGYTQPSTKGDFAAINHEYKKQSGKLPFVSESASNPFKTRSHAPNFQPKQRHTNRQHSRKQAKLRAKRKAK